MRETWNLCYVGSVTWRETWNLCYVGSVNAGDLELVSCVMWVINAGDLELVLCGFRKCGRLGTCVMWVP